jgi:hypothetical protein
VTVTLRAAEGPGHLRKALDEYDVDEEVRDRLGKRIVVSEGDGVLFLYTQTREAAREAEQVVRDLLTEHGLEAEFAIDRWHPAEERWEDERVPMPRTEAEEEAERDRLEQDEIAESNELGAALWEVRVELDSLRDALALDERLSAESESLLPGWTCSVERRWKYVLIGADTEEQATEIAERIRNELPPGATIHVEPSGALAWRVIGNNPFAVVGGLGS